MATPPIPAPDDKRVLTSIHSPIAAALGHFLLFGICGQIIFTCLILSTTVSVNGSTRMAAAAADKQITFIWIPLACSVAGMVLTKGKRIGGLERPWLIILLVLTTIILWMLDLSLMGRSASRW